MPSTGTTVTHGDIRIVPFNHRAGGTPVTLVATADNEYYPAFSPDDRLVVFDRVPSSMSSYNNAQAELYVVRADGTLAGVALTGAPRPDVAQNVHSKAAGSGFRGYLAASTKGQDVVAVGDAPVCKLSLRVPQAGS